jgi:DNA-binding transcriptional MocR family regulator
VVGSLSKSFGLPGLRIGWLIAPVGTLEDIRRRHEYAAIAASTVSMHLAEIALESDRRAALLDRGRRLIETGLNRLLSWIDCSRGALSVVPPQATAMAFVRCHADVQALRSRTRSEGNSALWPASARTSAAKTTCGSITPSPLMFWTPSCPASLASSTVSAVHAPRQAHARRHDRAIYGIVSVTCRTP